MVNTATPSILRAKQSTDKFLWLFDLEHRGPTIFRNVGKFTHNNETPHPRELENSAAPLWEAQISQNEEYLTDAGWYM